MDIPTYVALIQTFDASVGIATLVVAILQLKK